MPFIERGSQAVISGSIARHEYTRIFQQNQGFQGRRTMKPNNDNNLPIF
jgi:hypothetical protein